MNRRYFIKSCILLLPSTHAISQIIIPHALTNIKYYGVFFVPSRHNQICFSHSLDLKVWKDFSYFEYNNHPLSGRDPSIIYYKGIWLLALTGCMPDKYDFSLFSSPDMKSWHPHYIQLGGSNSIASNNMEWDGASVVNNHIWAPEFVLDSESNLYVVISVLMKKSDSASKSESIFNLYISKFEDKKDDFKFTKAKRINLVDFNGLENSFSRIDPFILYDCVNKHYILSAKRENHGVLDFFSAKSIYGDYSYIGTLDLHYIHHNMDIEGPSIVYQSGVWFVYFDSYYLNEGILYVTTLDFKVFSKPKKIGQKEFSFFRHGTVRNI